MSSASPEAQYAKKEVSAGIITSRRFPNSREFLLLQHANGKHWSFPKGHIEEGEDPKETARRELTEETSLNLQSLVSEFSLETSYTFERSGRRIFKKVIYFLGFVSLESQVVLSHEHLDYTWLTYDDAWQKLTYENDRELLDKAAERLGERSSLDEI